MKVTPLDIRRKEFKRGMRGYADEEVDLFLDDVADEFERLFQENMELQDRIQRMEEQIAGHTQLKNALEKTLVSAQLQADQMIANARKEAELTMRDAELKSRHIVNDSYAETQRVQQSLVQLKHLEEDFRFKFQSLLEGYLKLLAEAPIAPPQAAAAASAAAAVQTADLATATDGAALAPPSAVEESESADTDVLHGEAQPDVSRQTFVTPPVDEPEPPAQSEPRPLVAAPADEDGEDTPTEETEIDETVLEDRAFESPADYEVHADEPTAELPGDTAEPEDFESLGEDVVNPPDSEPQRFFFGRRVEPGDEGFFSEEDPTKDKSRDFEW